VDRVLGARGRHASPPPTPSSPAPTSGGSTSAAATWRWRWEQTSPPHAGGERRFRATGACRLQARQAECFFKGLL
jgi:hypothetical protein